MYKLTKGRCIRDGVTRSGDGQHAQAQQEHTHRDNDSKLHASVVNKETCVI